MPTPRPSCRRPRRCSPSCRARTRWRHLQRGGELPTEAFSGANALEMLTYLSLQALPRHSRTFSNVHLAGGWHDPVELKGVQTAVAEHAPHLLRGLSAEEIAQMAQRAASGGNHMSVQHAMDAAEVKIDLEEDEQDEEMQRHARLAKGSRMASSSRRCYRCSAVAARGTTRHPTAARPAPPRRAS